MIKLNKKIKKLTALTTLTVTLALSATPALAKTVYYKGYAVEWNYGRTPSGLWGYSEVQTGHFTHRATVNGTNSGWKRPGVLASAKKFIGNGHVEAYWDCK